MMMMMTKPQRLLLLCSVWLASLLLDAFNCQTNTSAVDDRTAEPILGSFYDGICGSKLHKQSTTRLFSAWSLQSHSWRYCKNVEIFCIHCNCFIDFVSIFVIFLIYGKPLKPAFHYFSMAPIQQPREMVGPANLS